MVDPRPIVGLALITVAASVVLGFYYLLLVRPRYQSDDDADETDPPLPAGIMSVNNDRDRSDDE